MKATQISRLAASVAGVTLLTACGHSSNGEAGRSCAASVLLEGHRYNAVDRYGVPIKLASSLEQPVTVPGCLDGERDEVTTRGWAIEGIPHHRRHLRASGIRRRVHPHQGRSRPETRVCPPSRPQQVTRHPAVRMNYPRTSSHAAERAANQREENSPTGRCHMWDHPWVSDRDAEPHVSRTARAGRTPEDPVALILVGFFVGAILGGGLILVGAASDASVLVLLGYLLLVVGSVITSVGIIAAGVRLGMRWARLDESA